MWEEKCQIARSTAMIIFPPEPFLEMACNSPHIRLVLEFLNLKFHTFKKFEI